MYTHINLSYAFRKNDKNKYPYISIQVLVLSMNLIAKQSNTYAPMEVSGSTT